MDEAGKRTEGYMLIGDSDVDETAECGRCAAPAILYHLETGRYRCLSCVFDPAVPSYGPGFAWTGPYVNTEMWCRQNAPQGVHRGCYCSLQTGHTEELHEAWYSGEDPRRGDPIAAWAAGEILFDSGRWLRGG